MKKLVIIVLFLIALTIPFLSATAAVSETPPCGHNRWDEPAANWRTKIKATCKDYGVLSGRCPECYYLWERPVAKTDDHLFKSATCSQPSTCSVCGATKGYPVAHSFSTATCIERSTCKFCKIKIGDFASHTFNLSSTPCTEVPVCAVCKIKYAGHGSKHNFPSGVCNETVACRACGFLKSIEHNWVNYDGYRRCSRCNNSEMLRKPNVPFTE